MTSQIVLITGATSGIGKQTAQALAQQGATVIITGRNKATAEQAVQEIRQQANSSTIQYLLADLATQTGVRQLANDFQKQYKHLDVLINNAGSAANTYQKTPDGIETNFAVNVITPYLLTTLLVEHLKKAPQARVITLMGGNLPKSVDLQNLQSEKGFDGLNTYSNTKIAMMCVMYEYAQQLKDTNITCNICYPGQAATEMTQNVTADMFPWLLRPFFPVFKLLTRPDGGKSAKKAARSSIFLASAAEVSGKTGLYVNKNVQIVPLPNFVLIANNRKKVWETVQTALK
ncbi:MAG: SDR family NAD(P)-dependent oxidoreductase [Chitinophagales bacterium]|nr:SDR family NAD(P)-dependent oxidoreductase [Chitinophagales bacterium]